MSEPDVPDQELWNPTAQGLDHETLEARNRQRVGEEWQRVWEVPVPYLRDLYEEAGLSADEVPPLDRIPRCSKADFRGRDEVHPPFGDYRAISLEEAVRVGASTGTTGRPTIIFYGRRDLEALVELGSRVLWRHGMRPGERFTHSYPLGLYPTGVLGGRTFMSVGLLEIPVGPPFSPQEARSHLELWQILRPHGFMLTSAQFRTYEDAAQEAGVDFGELLDGAKVACLEALLQFEAPRRRMEETYGIRVHNIAGASEIPGFATSDCRFHTGFHAGGDHFVLQACDPETGEELPEGERGTLVVTATGLDTLCLRYDVEDIVSVTTGTCPCGETGPRYRLWGRAADAVRVDGRLLLPLDVQLALDDLGGPEFQLIQGGGDGVLRARVEGNEPAEIEAVLRERLEVPTEVETVEPGSLPTSSFKPRRVAQA